MILRTYYGVIKYVKERPKMSKNHYIPCYQLTMKKGLFSKCSFFENRLVRGEFSQIAVLKTTAFTKTAWKNRFYRSDFSFFSDVIFRGWILQNLLNNDVSLVLRIYKNDSLGLVLWLCQYWHASKVLAYVHVLFAIKWVK